MKDSASQRLVKYIFCISKLFVRWNITFYGHEHKFWHSDKFKYFYGDVIYLNCCILYVYVFSFVNLEYLESRNGLRLSYKLSISKFYCKFERYFKFGLSEIFLFRKICQMEILFDYECL